MIWILIYFGGETRYGQHGVEYSVGPRYSFSANAKVGFGYLASTIYNGLGLDEHQYNLSIMARVINRGMIEHQCFQLAPVIDDHSWNLMYNMTVNAETQYKVLELYVEANALVLGTQGPLQPLSIPGPSRPPNVVRTKSA